MIVRLKNLWAPALVGLFALAAVAAPAVAKKTAKPVKTTLYMHGSEVVGELESTPIVADAYLTMDANEPEGAEPKSHGIANGVVTPNHQCAGNNLYPVFVGEVSGRIVGDMKVTLHAVSTPGQVDVRVWPDVASLLCTSELAGTTDYPEPAAEATVDLPPGHGTIEAVFEDVNFAVGATLMVQVSPETTAAGPEEVFAPFVARVLYDATDFASSIEFQCIPAGRAKTCTP